jgi:peptidoglycan/xylan/chitin deacetylase (PgdA/CDA1 family)
MTTVFSTLLLTLILTVNITAKTVWKGDPNTQKVALTFDDGPKPGESNRILNILDKYGVRATFFVIGQKSLEYPDLIYRIHSSGHDLANHSYSHTNLTTLSYEEILKELTDTNSILEADSRTPIRFFRPPGGKYNKDVLKAAETLGLDMIMWDVNSGDYATRLSKEHDPIDKSVLEKTRGGSIILLHNGGEKTIEALPKIITGLQKRGYQLVPLRDMLPI